MRSMALLLPIALACACATTGVTRELPTAPAPAPVAMNAGMLAMPTEPTPPAAAPDDCVLNCGSAVAASLEIPKPEYHVDEAQNADAVFSTMHDDLLACYRARVAVSREAHATLAVDVLVAPDGSVRTVDATGGAALGDRTLRCIKSRIQRATFAPVRGGGTLRVKIPLTFALRDPNDDST